MSILYTTLYTYHSKIDNRALSEHFKKHIFGLNISEIVPKELSTKKLLKHTFKIIHHRVRENLNQIFRIHRNA